jgi:tetratricopeptide (TPR) repeat protein
MKAEQIAKDLNEIARLEISGRYDEAMSMLRPLLDTQTPGPYIVEAYAVLSTHFNEQEKALGLLQKTLRHFSLNPPLQSRLQFQAGNLCDSLQEYGEAFSHYQFANDALPAQFNPAAYEVMIQAQKKFFTQSSFAELARAELRSELPVFIVGMPRSGTSLTEQIMDRHSRIHGAGELNAMNEIIASLQQRWSLATSYPECLNDLTSSQLNEHAEQYLAIARKDDTRAACITDKMPSNCAHLGFIEMMLPSARVIHCRRHPVDTCLSCYFQNFANAHQYSRRLDYLAKMYRLYLDMVNMWDGVITMPTLEVRYEDMVSNQEVVTRKLIEFCGLDWEDQCLSFNESERYVNTCSYNQVRKPMYTSSVHRWKNYEKHVGPLLAELDDIIEEYDSLQY